MKRLLFGLAFTALVLLTISSVGTQSVFAQVPPGVVVDSIAPANSWLDIFPYRSHSIVADPRTGKYAFIPGQAAAGGNPVWLSSTDAGVTWSSLTGFLPAAGGRVAIAADSNFKTYITYREGFGGATDPTGIYLNSDPNGDGTGLGTPKLVNDTTSVPFPNYPDIVVSRDGKHIIISAIRRSPLAPGSSDAPLIDSVYVFVSHDSGHTFQTKVIVDPYSPALKPVVGPVTTEPTMWYTGTLAMGANGFVSYVVELNYDTTQTVAGRTYWEVYTESKDYGDTWSAPEWVGLPPSTEYLPGVNFAWQAPSVATDSITHIVERMLIPSEQAWELVEFHKQNGTWVHSAITHYDPLTTSYQLGCYGSLGVDSQGRLYCLYTDQNKSAIPSYADPGWTTQLFIAGSSDGGNTWTGPVRLTDREPIAIGDSGTVRRVAFTRLPSNIPDKAVGIFLNGEDPDLYSTPQPPAITAWVEARFPLGVVWTGPYDKDERAPKAGGYSIASKGAPAFTWYEISGMGTKVTGWRNGSVSIGDTARDDGYAGPFPIGFDFQYYGKSYSTFSVGANALLGLSDSILNSAAASPSPSTTRGFYDASYSFPGPGNPFHSVIAAYYNDLDLSPHSLLGTGNGDVYYWSNPANDTLVVEWYHAGDFNSTNDTTLTFEVILAKADSSIGVMFKDIGTTGTEQTAKVGIQASDTVGVSYWLAGFPQGNTPAPNTGVIFVPREKLGTGIAGSEKPLAFALRQNYPNPFNPSTRITYSLPRQVKATLKVFNILGQEVATLVDEIQQPGQHTVTFDASRLASGVYLYRLQAGEFTSSYKMILMK